MQRNRPHFPLLPKSLRLGTSVNLPTTHADDLPPGMSLNFPIIASSASEEDRTTGSAEWIIIDSGAQHPLVGNKDLLTELKLLQHPQYFKTGNGDLMKATHSGSLGRWKGVLYSKDCSFNLMPVHWLRKVVYESGTRINMSSDSGSRACAHLLEPPNTFFWLTAENLFPCGSLGFESREFIYLMRFI